MPHKSCHRMRLQRRNIFVCFGTSSASYGIFWCEIDGRQKITVFGTQSTTRLSWIAIKSAARQVLASHPSSLPPSHSAKRPSSSALVIAVVVAADAAPPTMPAVPRVVKVGDRRLRSSPSSLTLCLQNHRHKRSYAPIPTSLRFRCKSSYTVEEALALEEKVVENDARCVLASLAAS